MPRGVYPRKPKKAPLPRQLQEVKSHIQERATVETDEFILISIDTICKLVAEAAVRGYKQK